MKLRSRLAWMIGRRVKSVKRRGGYGLYERFTIAFRACTNILTSIPPIPTPLVRRYRAEKRLVPIRFEMVSGWHSRRPPPFITYSYVQERERESCIKTRIRRMIFLKVEKSRRGSVLSFNGLPQGILAGYLTETHEHTWIHSLNLLIIRCVEWKRKVEKDDGRS